MSKKKRKKKEPLKTTIFTISIIFIVYMLSKKDIAAIFANTPKEHILPLIASTIAISLLKIVGMAALILLIKWLFKKFKKKK